MGVSTRYVGPMGRACYETKHTVPAVIGTAADCIAGNSPGNGGVLFFIAWGHYVDAALYIVAGV
jgi:hypothetical protein